jgi:ABC-type branched-subunit amino acid transport system ATPase component
VLLVGLAAGACSTLLALPLAFALVPSDRGELHRRIARRFDAMLSAVAERLRHTLYIRHLAFFLSDENCEVKTSRFHLKMGVGLKDRQDLRARSLGTPGRKRLEIARALAMEPKVLLLDEAMAGLTPTEVREAIELVRRIHGGGITIVIVEHIMEVIVSLASRVVVFHQGKEIARGTPQEVTRNERVIEAYLGKRHAAKLSGGAA